MEFLDEYESRPRFLFQSKNHPSGSDQVPSSLRHPAFFLSIFTSLVILTLALLHFDFEPLKSILLWFSISLLLGPFAPPSLTAGDIRVGLGPPLEETPDDSVEPIEKFTRKSRKKPSEDAGRILEKSRCVDGSDSPVDECNRLNGYSVEKRSEEKRGEQSEWCETDDDLLMRLMGKHPAGKPGRWDAIAEGFKGKYRVDTVITRAKEMGERKVGDQDSFNKFLKDRKAVDKRVLDEAGNVASAENGSVIQNVEAWRKEIVDGVLLRI